MINRIAAYIKKNELFPPNATIIVGVSGGADSVALLDVLYKLNYSCVVAHCNFHLRGDESMRDEYFVESLVEKYKLPYEKIDFDTIQWAHKKSISIEMAARELRYTWFAQLSEKYHTDYIAVAHHSDDNIETVLLNLTRGTGILGLTGIAPKNGRVVRPFLDISRKDILTYLSENGLSHVDDSSNADSHYRRNKIRNEIVPLFESMNPAFRRSMRQTMEHLSEVNAVYLDYIESQKKMLCESHNDEVWINIMKLKNMPHNHCVLFEILKDFSLECFIDDVQRTLNSISGKQFFNDDYWLVKDRDFLKIKLKKSFDNQDFDFYDEESKNENLPLKFKLTFLNEKPSSFEKDENVAYFDADKLQFPLKLRRWKDGDKFVPFGMKGTKKVSDLLIDKKLDLIQKEAIWVLCNNEEICWVVSLRSDNRYAISSKTRKILKIERKN